MRCFFWGKSVFHFWIECPNVFESTNIIRSFGNAWFSLVQLMYYTLLPIDTGKIPIICIEEYNETHDHKQIKQARVDGKKRIKSNNTNCKHNLI